MKRIGFCGMVCAATLLLLSSCDSSNSTSMVGPTDTGTGSSLTGAPASGQAEKVDQALDALNPELVVLPMQGNTYRMSMIVGAGGTASSPDVQVLHGIREVRFAVYTPTNQMIATQATDSVPMSGVMNSQTGQISVTAATGVNYTPATQLPVGTYAVMTIQGANGVAIRSTTIPYRQFAH